MGATAIIGSAVGSSIIGGIAQSNAAGKASSEEAQANANAIAAQQGFFNTANQNLQPYIQTGNSAANEVSQLEGLNGGTPSSIQATLQSLPGYQFANTQGLKSVQNSATARGLGVSGASQKGAANFSTGLANQYYNNLLQGVQATENTGEQAAGSLGQLAVGTGQGVGQSYQNMGQAAGAAALSQGSAIANGANSLPNSLIASQIIQNNNNNANNLQGVYSPADLNSLNPSNVNPTSNSWSQFFGSGQ